jgi:hypothetical protein
MESAACCVMGAILACLGKESAALNWWTFVFARNFDVCAAKCSD